MNPRIADKDAKRAQILDAAVRAFSRNGYHPTRVGDVAREAGVANGTVYLYFTGRDEILAAALERFTDQVTEAMEEALASSGAAADRLRAVIRAMVEHTQAEPDLSRLLLDFGVHQLSDTSAQGNTGDFGETYAELRATLGRLLSQATREGDVRDDLSSDASTVILGALEGIVLQWIVDPHAVSPVETIEPLLDILFHGLSPRGSDE